MVERSRRRIRSKTVRTTGSSFVRHKAAEVGATVLDVSEAYTTKTVSWTGEMQENLGGASVVVAQDGERKPTTMERVGSTCVRVSASTESHNPPVTVAHLP